MRVNVYAEEMTERVEIISKEIDSQKFTGLRLYLELPATVNGQQHQGPFLHRPGDDDSSAVTFWGKRDLRIVLRKMLALLDEHYGAPDKRQAAFEAMRKALRYARDHYHSCDGGPLSCYVCEKSNAALALAAEAEKP